MGFDMDPRYRYAAFVDVIIFGCLISGICSKSTSGNIHPLQRASTPFPGVDGFQQNDNAEPTDNREIPKEAELMVQFNRQSDDVPTSTIPVPTSTIPEPLDVNGKGVPEESKSSKSISVPGKSRTTIPKSLDVNGKAKTTTPESLNIPESTTTQKFLDVPEKARTTQAPQVDCKLIPENSTISKFRHNVYYNDLTFVYLRLKPSGNFSIHETDGTVGGTIWVWTFYGKEGGLEFLDWPIEFEIWSMGLLTPYVRGPYDVTLLRERGQCEGLTVGQNKSDIIISEALVNLPITLMNMNLDLQEKYGPSFFCYKKRMFLNPPFFYGLCKHIVCPIESLKYKCCSYFFNTKLLKREITCDIKSHEYDDLWWVWPIVIATILFAYVPLPLMSFARRSSVVYHKRNRKPSLRNLASNEDPEEEVVFLDDSFPVTLCSTLWDPISNVCFKKYSFSPRLFRFLLPFLSLSLILLQILLDYNYLHGFVLTSIQKGVLLGFRSMAAGYEESRHNFMPLFGGPYVTLGLYLFITCVAVTFPPSLSNFLARGLQHRVITSEARVPFLFDLKRVEQLGSVPVLRLGGFHRIYNTYLGQFYMLLNIKLWKEVWDILTTRWRNFAVSRPHCILLPLYVVLCSFEVLLCIAINGFPIISFAITIIRAYSFFNVFNVQPRSLRLCYKIPAGIISVILVVVVFFFLYMFCTIFMDATLFITRIFIFTYTGIVIYPKLSYGYLIFSFTVFYYIWDCVRNYSLFYWRVLKITLSACDYVQKINDGSTMVIVDNEKRVKGVRRSVFEHVIETHCPRRKQVFVSILKLLIILGVIGGSLSLLTKTDKFQELHVLMHVGTALFTCALPMILKAMCRGPGKNYKNKKFEYDVRRSVANFVGYLAVDSDETERESD